jgi:serine protease Do
MLPDMPQFPPGSPFEEFFKDFMDKQMQGGDDEGGDAPPQHKAIPRKATSLGSGFVIDPEGLIVTNNHVIAEADEIHVIFHDNSDMKAEIVGRDTKLDIALLRVKTTKKLTAVSFGDSDVARVGDWVLAIGNPFGLGGTVTAGIISARARDINAGPYDDFIQTDASINRGNSGGPLFNLKGEVIGINTAIFSPSGGSVGIGFSIPSSLAKPVVDQLKKFGRTKRGWLGVRIQTVTPEIAESLGLKGEPRGALVAGVTPKGPAESAKIEPGDIILKFAGKDLSDMRRLPRLVAETPIGSDADIVVFRKGAEKNMKVKIAQLEEAEDKNLIPGDKEEPKGKDKDKPVGTVKSLGMTLSPITPLLRQKHEIGDEVRNGAIVTAVDPAANAAEMGMRVGDVVTEASQDPIKSVDDLVAKIEKAKAEKKKSILLLVYRAGDLRFVALKLE